MTPKHVVFNNTVLRDGHQSMAATRMTTAQMLPAAEILDGMGFGMLETWGGATIDACLRFLGEQPFDRVRALRAAAPKTPHGMLLRGQNIVQYTCFPDDVVEAFVSATVSAGIQVLRIFDALNDIRNLRTAIAATRKSGAHARGEICYTTSPVHTIDAFIRFSKELEEAGCQSISIKDMSGILVPRTAAELIAGIRKATRLPVTLHSHDTAGLAASSYLAAIDAGVDAVETSIAPFANGTSQPDTLRMLTLLEGHPRRPDIDATRLAGLREYFTGVYDELAEFTSPANHVVDSDTLLYQVPGGMLSNFRVQLRELGMLDRILEVLAEIPHVRCSLGWPPLVTPISQIVGTQAMLNVKFGRWKNFAAPAMDIALGKYGRTPGPIDREVLALAVKNTRCEPLTAAPSESLAPRMAKLREELSEKGLPADDEAAVLYAMFPREYETLVRGTRPPAISPPQPASAPTPQASPVAASAGPGRRLRFSVDGTSHEAIVEELG